MKDALVLTPETVVLVCLVIGHFLSRITMSRRRLHPLFFGSFSYFHLLIILSFSNNRTLAQIPHSAISLLSPRYPSPSASLISTALFGRFDSPVPSECLPLVITAKVPASKFDKLFLSSSVPTRARLLSVRKPSSYVVFCRLLHPQRGLYLSSQAWIIVISFRLGRAPLFSQHGCPICFRRSMEVAPLLDSTRET